MRKPLSIIAYLLVIAVVFAYGAQAMAADKTDAKASQKKTAQRVMKWDEGGKDLIASLNADAEKSAEEKDTPVYITALSFIFKLGIVIALAYGTIYGLKRFSGLKGSLGGSAQRIRVVENTTLGTNRSLHIVEIGSKKLLVASTPSQINLVTELATDDIPETQTPAQSQDKSFKDQIAGFMGGKPQSGEAAQNVAQMLKQSSMTLQERIMDVGRLRRKFRDAGTH